MTPMPSHSQLFPPYVDALRRLSGHNVDTKAWLPGA